MGPPSLFFREPPRFSASAQGSRGAANSAIVCVVLVLAWLERPEGEPTEDERGDPPSAHHRSAAGDPGVDDPHREPPADDRGDDPSRDEHESEEGDREP